MLHEVLGPASSDLLTRLCPASSIMHHSHPNSASSTQLLALSNPNVLSSFHLQKLMVYQIEPLEKTMMSSDMYCAQAAWMVLELHSQAASQCCSNYSRTLSTRAKRIDRLYLSAFGSLSWSYPFSEPLQMALFYLFQRQSAVQSCKVIIIIPCPVQMPPVFHLGYEVFFKAIIRL